MTAICRTVGMSNPGESDPAAIVDPQHLPWTMDLLVGTEEQDGNT